MSKWLMFFLLHHEALGAGGRGGGEGDEVGACREAREVEGS